MNQAIEENGNVISEIRQGLFQYIGAIGKECGLDGDDAMQKSVSVVEEELLRFCGMGNEFNFYAAKPILRGAAYMIDMNIGQAKKDADEKDIDIADMLKPLEFMSAKLKQMADSYKKKQ